MRLQLSLWIALFVLAFSIPGWRQAASSRLQGTVLDPSGSSIPGAQVSAVSTRTQAHSETTANREGQFLFPSLQPDTYNLHVIAPGFPATVNSIDLTAPTSET